MIRIKRIYEPPATADGHRLLVDRLWPRGLRKDEARIDGWRRDLAPTNALREWYGHDPGKWDEFRLRYRNELDAAGKSDELREIAGRARRGTVTLLYSSREERHNNAAALKEIIDGLPPDGGSRRVSGGRARPRGRRQRSGSP